MSTKVIKRKSDVGMRWLYADGKGYMLCTIKLHVDKSRR